MIIDDPLKMMVYAPPGHGKTTFLASAIGDERLMPMLIIEFEGGTRSIRSKVDIISVDDLAERRPTPDKIDVVRIREWEDFNAVYAFLADENEVYRSVALDSLSEMNYLLLMGKVLGDAVAEDRKHDPDLAEQRDYLRSYNMLRKLVRHFRDLDIHVFMTATTITERGQLQPNLNGKLAMEIPGLVDFCFYLAVAQNEDGTPVRVLVTEPEDKFYAKQRTEMSPLPSPTDHADLKLLADALIGPLEPASTKTKKKATVEDAEEDAA